jgi:hypothetical protein
MAGLLLPVFAMGGDTSVELGFSVAETVPVEYPVAKLLYGMRDDGCEHTSVGFAFSTLVLRAFCTNLEWFPLGFRLKIIPA